MNGTKLWGAIVAGVSGAFLIPIMAIPDWFGLENKGALVAVPSAVTGNAWASYGFTDVVLFITALAAIGFGLLGLVLHVTERGRAGLPRAASAIVAGLGIVSVLLVVISIISPPDVGGAIDVPSVEHSRKIGVWLGLIATAAIAVGGYVTMQEGSSFGDDASHLGGDDAGVGIPQPPSSSPPPSKP
jgi:hypothetical protein